MATLKNFAVRAIMMVLCAVLGFTTLTSCNEGGKDLAGNEPTSSKITTITFEPNSSKDGGNVIFTISDGVTPKSARIAVSSAVTADNDYEISVAQKAVSFTAAGDMVIDGTAATRRFNGSDAHPVSTTAMQDKLAVEIDGQMGVVEFTGVNMTNVKVNDNTALQPEQGQRERMSTPVKAVWTGKATFAGKEKSFELNPATSAIRWIAENAPEIVDSIIDWTNMRSGYEALAQRDSAWVQVVYLLSDGSRLDGMRYTKSAPRTLWGSENKMYVSAFEQNIGANFSGMTTVDSEKKDNELSDTNWTISYETVQRNWNHEQVDVDGNKAVTSLFSKLPHFNFVCGKLSVDFGRLPLNVEKTSVEVVDKSPVTEDGKSYEVKQLKNTISTTYGVDSTGIQNQQVVSTVDLLKLNVKPEPAKLDSVSAKMRRTWAANQGTFTWKLTEHYSDGSKKDTTIVWSGSRSIEAKNFEKEDVKKALSEGSVKTEVAHSDVKSVVNPSYTIRYKVATATYSWVNTFVKESATSIVTSSLPENVSLEYKGYKFNQPADEISYTKETGVLIDSYDDGSKKIYDYKANFFESVKGYNGSSAKAIATGTLTVNAAVPTDWELLSKTNEYFMFNHTVGAKYRVTYSDGSTQEFEFNNVINGESASTPVETTEDEVSERVGAPSDYILNKENKKVNEYLSYAQWTTKVTETSERSRGSHEYGFTYSIGREVKYVRDFGNGVVVEISFEDPTISHNTETTDFVKTGEEEVENGTKETWRRNNNLLVNINGKNNTIANYGIINIFEAAQEVPEAPAAVIGGGIVSPKPGLTDNMYYVGYLLKLNNGKVRPLIVDKNGQNVELGEEFDANSAWNGAAYINGTLYPVLGSNTGSMLKYTHKAGVSYAISAVNAGDGFNWNHAQVENVTGHYKPVIKKQGGKTILTLEGVSGWSMSF